LNEEQEDFFSQRRESTNGCTTPEIFRCMKTSLWASSKALTIGRSLQGLKQMKLERIAALIAMGLLTTTATSQSLPNLLPLPNPSGWLETYNVNNSPISLSGAFFQSLGTNGRSCASCHLPSQGWTVSASGVQLRFLLTQGLDPIFRTNDGSNCDQNIDTSTVEGRRQAYSLLLSRGLIRVALSVPAGAEFTVQSVDNPYGCNDTSTLSMYRRPLPAANLELLSTLMWDGRESTPPSTQKITYPNTGQLLADLGHQAMDATTGHAQGAPPTQAQIQDIVSFETALRTAQAIDNRAGFLNGGRATGGPVALASQEFFIGINDSFPASFGFNPTGAPFNPKIFTLFDAWKNSRSTARASIATGQAIFNSKPITISGVAGINDVTGMPASFTGTCGTCHDSPNIGHHSVSAPLNIGVADVNSPLNVRYLPVFTLIDNASGETVQTTDPGRALITGKWADIAKVKGPILRGLAGRAPYFHNGSAATLADVILFYEMRFNIGFAPQEKADLIAFLNSL
jgi:cytochrome c peroxidase